MKRLTTGVVAVLLTLTAAACGDKGGDAGSSTTGSTTTTESSSSGSSGDAVAWVDKVCAGLKDGVAAMTTQPELDQSSPQAAKDSLVTYLGNLETTLDGMASAVQDAGTPPVDGGDEAVKGFLDQITTAKGAVTSAKSKIDAAPVDDPAAFQAAASAATSDLAALSNMEDPTKSFAENEELSKAYDEAPACQELESGSSSPTS